MAHNTPMKCGNRGCDYELYSQEADFLVCPGCGDPVLLDRVRSVPCDRRLHTPADRVMDRGRQLRLWAGLAYAMTASLSLAWYWGGPDRLTRELLPNGGDIFIEASPYLFAFAMVGGLTRQLVPQMRLWVDDPNWITNTKAQMLARSLPIGVWTAITMAFWSYPSVANLQEAVQAHTDIASQHPQLVTACILGAYLVPLIAGGVGVLAEGLEVVNQQNIARINAFIRRGQEAFPQLHADEEPNVNKTTE